MSSNNKFLWVSTHDILSSPDNYFNKSLILGSKFSLITGNINTDSTDNRFFGWQVVEYIVKDSSIYVLVEVPSMEAYKLLKDKFMVENMSYPEISCNMDDYVHYHVTAILPDMSLYSFSQLIKR